MKYIKLFENFNEIIEEQLIPPNVENFTNDTLEEVETETNKVLNFVDFKGE